MGVIFEAADDVLDLLVPFLRAEGSTSPIEAVQGAYIRASLGRISAAQLWRELLPGSGNADELNARYLEGHRVRPEALALVEAANDREMMVACVSNDVSEWSLSLRTSRRLDESITHWIVSGDVGIRKPDAAIFEHALATLDVSPADCVFVDDRAANIETATGLGMTALHFVPYLAPDPTRPTQIERLTDAARWFTAP